MERCLHHPETGYYYRNIRGIGGRGDFTTAPELSDAPAKAIASWVATALLENKCRHLIEIGPGNGTLSKKVFRHLPLALRLRTKLHLVESSPILSKLQKALHGKSVRHHTDILSAMEECSGNAVVFSNELVDAFPVRLFEKSGSGWLEISVRTTRGIPSEISLPCDDLPPSSVFSGNFNPGQRVEVHESYRLWLESWLPLWKRGEMLTIDYGTTVTGLYHRRPKGSLRAYLLHQRLEGPEIYRNQGLQDLTADVNFTDLSDWAARWTGPGKILNFRSFILPFLEDRNDGLLAACEHFHLIIQKAMNDDSTHLKNRRF